MCWDIWHSWGHLEGCVGAAGRQHSGNAAGDERIQGLPLVSHHVKGPVECKVQPLKDACSKHHVTTGLCACKLVRPVNVIALSGTATNA